MSPPADEPDLPPDAVEVGRVAGAWGVKGWLRVVAHADDPQALLASRGWFIRAGARNAPARVVPQLLRISDCRRHGDGVVATAHEIPDREAAEALQGARVFVSRASFPTTGADEYYWVDLIGLEVVNRHGESLGTVAGLLETGAHCVLRLQPDGGEQAAAATPDERLIPFVNAYIDSVDLRARRIVADWGLDY